MTYRIYVLTRDGRGRLDRRRFATRAAAQAALKELEATGRLACIERHP